MEKKSRSYSLSDEAVERLRIISEKMEVSASTALAQLIKKEWEQMNGIGVSPTPVVVAAKAPKETKEEKAEKKRLEAEARDREDMYIWRSCRLSQLLKHVCEYGLKRGVEWRRETEGLVKWLRDKHPERDWWNEEIFFDGKEKWSSAEDILMATDDDKRFEKEVVWRDI